MRTVTSELAKETRIDRTKAYRTSDKPLCQKLMTLFLITSFSKCKISLKLDILGILLVAILVVTLSTGVVEAALLKVQGGPLDDPILKPINSILANISNDNIKVTKITVFTYLDGERTDKWKFTHKVKLVPGEDFSFSPELGQLSGTPIVTIFGKIPNSINDPDNPGSMAVLFAAPDLGESPNLQVDFLSAISSDPDGTTLGVIIENTGLDPLKITKIQIPKVDTDPGTEGTQEVVIKIKQNLAPGDSLTMKFNLEDIDSNPIVLEDVKKVKVKLGIQSNDGMKYKIYQKIKVQ